VSDIFLTNSNFNLASEQVLRPPSATVFGHHFSRRTQGWVRLEERDSPLEVAWPNSLPRAAIVSCQFRRVAFTRRTPVAGSSSDLFRHLCRLHLNTFSGLVFRFWQVVCSSPCVSLFFFIRVSVFDQKWLLLNSLVNKKLDKFYMVLILRSLHSDFDHVRDQVLAGDQVPSMDSLITRLLRVPHVLKNENLVDVVETSAMVAPRGRGGGRSGRGGRPHLQLQFFYCWDKVYMR